MTPGTLKVEVLETAEAVAQRSAQLLVDSLRETAQQRGRASFAVSGGRTPALMLRFVAAAALPWERLDLFQVDERVAPAGHADRNAEGVRKAFAQQCELHPERFHWMPVEQPDLAAGARTYASELAAVAGEPAMLDVIHLGLGDDGHTASIFPGAATTNDAASDVTVTGVHLGRRRMTLTMAAINRARLIVWVVTGREKQLALAKLLAGDPTLVASRVRRTGVTVLADSAAAGSAL